MEDAARYVLIGGGLASDVAAQSIREHDQDGRIVVVGREKHPPYDRPPLSKWYLASEEWKPENTYRNVSRFYSQLGIELRTDAEATWIDRPNNLVWLASRDSIRYEKLLLATGASPHRPDLPGADLPGLFYLRTIDDADALRAALRDARRATIVGAGYLGMEVASACAQRGIEATLIEMRDRPLADFASPGLGKFLCEQYEAYGVVFVLNEHASAFERRTRRISVHTASGRELKGDVAVVCIGAIPEVGLAVDAGLDADAGGVLVNEFLQTSDPSIWAAGDIACFPDVAAGRRWRVEHYLNAKWQGAAAGAGMAGDPRPYNAVPYFFTSVLGMHICVRGDPQAGRYMLLLGDPDQSEFVELHYDDAERLRMGVGVSRLEAQADDISERLDELIRNNTNVRDVNERMFGL